MRETEFGYINWLQSYLSSRGGSVFGGKYGSDVLVGSGDDCAVIKLPGGRRLYATTDTIVEGVDFKGAAPEQIGYKSIAVSVSDLAAMGGVYSAIYALISAALSKKYARPSFTHPLFKGMYSICKKFGIRIIGGDMSSVRGPISVTSTLLGVSRSKPLLRSGARVGDAILVTGRLGGSILGRHLSFQPRLKESGYLNRRYKINAMIDISDGLLSDLAHILESSRVGAVLDGMNIPISSKASELPGDALQHAFNDGEDFELLFTAPFEEAVKISRDKDIKILVSIIGIITADKGIRLLNRRGRLMSIKPRGFTHF